MNMIFMGRKIYAAEMLKWSVEQGINVLGVCADEGKENIVLTEMACKLSIPIMDIKGAEELCSHQSVDLAVSYLFPRKIDKLLIESPKYGCINFHPAILPDWRGTAGYNIAILNKLSEWGATAHYVNEEIDMGPIIRCFKFSFDYRCETAVSLERKTQKIQMELYKSVLLDILENRTLNRYEQKKEAGKYISRNDMNEMKKADFNKDDLDLKIKAFWFPPYDGTYIEVNGKKYTLVNEELLKSLAEYGTGHGIT